MIPQEILSQLPSDLVVSQAKCVRLSASPASSLGESYLIAASNRGWLFVRDSLLSPFTEVLIQGRPRLLDESFDTFLCATKTSGEEVKIKVSLLEKDSIQALLSIAQTASALGVEPPDLTTKPEPKVPVEFVQTTPPSVAPRDLTPLPPEEREALDAQQTMLEEEAAAAISEGDLEAAKQKLLVLSALPFLEDYQLDEYRLSLVCIASLQQDKPREAFFLVGDYDCIYDECQYQLASHLGEQLEARGEKLLAAAAFSASEREEDAARLLTELQLSQSQLRPKVLQEALLFLEERARQYPSDDLSLSFFASLLQEENRHEESLHVAKQVISLAPHRRDGYEQAVSAALSLKRFEEASDLAQHIVTKYPTADWAYTLAGEVAEAKSDLNAGRKAFEEALRLNPGAIDAIEGLQKILRSQGEHKALAAHLEASAEHLSYKKEQVFEELAQLYEGPLKKPSEAKEFRQRIKESTLDSSAEEKTDSLVDAPEALRPPSSLGWVILLLIVIWLIWLR
jgi:tetratricopeptide (TPR) repeat protein